MKKVSNNSISQAPSYLKMFKYEKKIDFQKYIRQLVKNKFDFKNERMQFEEIKKHIKHCERQGGPYPANSLDGYPGDKAYVKQLQS